MEALSGQMDHSLWIESTAGTVEQSMARRRSSAVMHADTMRKARRTEAHRVFEEVVKNSGRPLRIGFERTLNPVTRLFPFWRPFTFWRPFFPRFLVRHILYHMTSFHNCCVI